MMEANRGLKVIILILMSITLGLACLFPNFEGDTRAVVETSKTLLSCLEQGSLPCHAHPFPLLTYLPTLIGIGAFGLSDHQAVLAWVLTSWVSFWLIFLIGIRNLSGWSRSTWALLCLSSPLVYYMRTSFSELLSSLLLLMLVVELCGRQRHFQIFLLSILSTIMKETFFPFLFGIVGLTLILNSRKSQNPLNWKWPMILGVLGIISGILLNFAFNLIRYDSILNLGYMIPEYHQWDWTLVLSSFFGAFFSLNFGLMWFWSLGFLLFVTLFIDQVPLLWRGVRRSEFLMTDEKIGIALIAVLIIYTFGLSFWWAPFGGLVWGNRLQYPLIPALSFLMLFFFSDALKSKISNIPRLLRSIFVMMVVLNAGFHSSMLVDNSVLANWYLKGDNRYPKPLVVERDPSAYRSYMRYLTWDKHPIYLDHLKSIRKQKEKRTWVNVYAVLNMLFACGFVWVLIDDPNRDTKMWRTTHFSRFLGRKYDKETKAYD